MKQFFLLITLSTSTLFATAQSVGIGTTSPNNNAILDVTSTNKGILLPRIADTSVISNPSAGLFVFNQNTNSPSYHDGSRWQNIINNITSTSHDSITYTVPSGAAALTAGTFPLTNLTQAQQTTGSNPSVSDFYMQKAFDNNSNNFAQNSFTGTHSSFIEFKLYLPSASIPYYSIKLYNFYTSNYRVMNDLLGGVIEQVQLKCTKIGFKDWVNNRSFGWDIAANMLTGY